MNVINETNYMFDPQIDERVKNICQQAENNYILNISKNNNLYNKRRFLPGHNFIEKDSSSLDKTVTKSDSEENKNILNPIQNDNFINYYGKEELQAKSIIENGQSLIQKANLIQNKSKSCNKFNKKNCRKNSTNYNNQSFKNKSFKLNKEMIDSINSKIKFKSNNIIYPTSLNIENNINSTIDNDLVNYNSKLLLSQSRINNNHYSHSNSFFSNNPSFCFECDLHKLINDNHIYNKDLNIKMKENKEINNIILSGKILLQKNNYHKAYNMLSLVIKQGIRHPDLFYLYGEACRKLKYMEDAQKYLLACLDYKNCSPYAYLSLAQLYEEIGQIKYSKKFYKKCLLYSNFNNSNIYFKLGVIYMRLNKLLKAINCLTEAIKLEPNQPLYYKYRSQIYKSLGHKDLYLKDLYKYNRCLNVK